MSHRFTTALFCCLLISGLFSSAAQADDPKLPPPPTEFELLIGRIRKAAASDEWRKPEWKDDKLSASLDKLVAAAKATTGKPSLSVPVQLKDVSATADPRLAGIQGGLLRVVKGNTDVGFAAKSVFLVDGSIRLGHVSDSIVIARGIVEIAHGNRNLIIAGHHVNASFDGMDGMRGRAGARGVAPPLADGGLIVSGGSINISHAHGTTCSAPKQIDISHATEVAFLASPDLKMSHQQGCSDHKDFATPFPIPVSASLPGSVLTVKQIVAPDDRTQQLLTVERNGMEYVLRPGAKLVDEKGQPLAGWANWSMGFITHHAAVFTDGQEDLCVRPPR